MDKKSKLVSFKTYNFAIVKNFNPASFEKVFQLLTLLIVSSVFVGCTAKYVEIENPSKNIELSCYSMKSPWEAKWYMWTYSLSRCVNESKFVTGGGEDIYIVDFSSDIRTWKNNFSNEFLLEQGEKFIKSEEKNLLELKEYEIENIKFENEIVQGVKEICAQMTTEYSFSTNKPFYYKTRSQTGEEIEFKLNLSDKYFFESKEFSVIEGPYKKLIGKDALIYQIKFTHISVNESSDSELEAKALNFLENLEVTVDWEKEVIEN